MKKGFTLVELLVVISIIGVLAGLVLVSFTSPQKQARDSQRKSDIKQYQTALEQFANLNNGLYPSRTSGSGVSADGTLCGDLGLSSCPEDPRQDKDPDYGYRYQSNGSSSGNIDADQYVLWGLIENTEDYWVVCSTGINGTVAESSWSNPSRGGCPL